MTTRAHDKATTLECSLDEAWVVHAALVDAIDAARDDGSNAASTCELLEAVEAGTLHFRSTELRLLRDVLISYLGDAPLRDRAAAREILGRVTTALSAA
ncbi:hypothetical protein ACNS7O_07310 [Haloferacaceae archaeon DSL9]